MERSDLSVSPNGGSQDSSADSEFGNDLETLHCRPVTREILREARSHVGHRDDGLPYTEYRQGDGGSFALLGCPNGSGVIRMLIDHCDALGRKTIASVCVVNDSPPVIYFVLAECDITAPASKSKRSQAGQERAAKRHQKNPPGEGQGSGCFDIA